MNEKKRERGKEGILPLFFATYIVAPEYFALEISAGLPLISFSRVMLVLLIISCVIKNRFKISLEITKNKLILRSLFFYLITVIICDLLFITKSSAALTDIFNQVFEHLLLVWVLSRMIKTRNDLESALEIILYSSGVVAIISITGSLLNTNFFYILNFIDRENTTANYVRLGIMRAAAGFGHAVYYGTYCAVMIPISMYFLQRRHGYKRSLHMIILLLNFFGLLFANSRGSQLAIALVLLYMAISMKNFWRYYGKYVFGTLILFFIFIITMPTVRSFILGVLKAFIYSFDSGANVDNYGNNLQGLDSRLIQFSAIRWTLLNSPIFGFGVNAFSNGAIRYWYLGRWSGIKSIDIGYVKILGERGLVGLMAFSCLYFSILKIVFQKSSKKDELLKMFRYAMLTYFICQFSITQVDKLFWILYALLVCYINIKRYDFETVKNS